MLGKKDYTNFLKDYSKYDVFEPLIEPEEDAEARDKNMFRKFNLSHCILNLLSAVCLLNTEMKKRHSWNLWKE